MTYKQFQNIVESMEPPPKPVPTLTMQMLGSAVTPISGKNRVKDSLLQVK
jgi:hypothetical protein